jgi:predicted transcriptional regulator
MGRITEGDWDTGVSASSAENTEAVFEAIQKEGKGGVDQEEIKEVTGLKYLYTALKDLVEANRIEKKKIGRRLYYRARE